MAKRSKNGRQEATLFKMDEGLVPAMPYGYYAGDQPNPNLRGFMEAHLSEHPYNAEMDDYDVPAFDETIDTTKATAIFEMHVYWSKKPHDAIRKYIRHYTKSGELVLDPFCGSGTTALAALSAGRKAVAIDRSPAASFITANCCTPIDVHSLMKECEVVRGKVQAEIDRLYETRCDRCGGKATTVSTVYSKVYQCSRCLEEVPLFDCVEVRRSAGNGKTTTVTACPGCHGRGILEPISTRGEKSEAIPVLVTYSCEGECRPRRAQRHHNDVDGVKRRYFEEFDLDRIREIDRSEIPHWFPSQRMLNAPEDQERWGLLWRPYLRGIDHVNDFFTKRNLWALAAILEACEESTLREPLRFVFQSNIFNGTKMQQYREAGGGFAKGTYYIPQIFIERNQLGCFARKVGDILRGQASLHQEIQSTALCVSTQSAADLGAIPSSSVDYVFTDPPYSWKVQFGEVNFIWEAWLKFDTDWRGEEVIINEFRGKGEDDWEHLMREAMRECYRVLKPGRWLSLCYHDTSEGTWALVQDLMAEVGFLVDKSEKALYIDAEQKSWKQIVADKVNKRDLVINFRKPKPSQLALDLTLTGDEDEATFNEKARGVIRDYLVAHSGATKDRIYDELVSHMVRAGRMEPHNFDELLRHVAEPIRVEGDDASNREAAYWFLKEDEVAVVDAAESAKEDAAADRLAEFIRRHLQANPGEDGLHHTDLWEHFVYTIPRAEKPRRPLADWLLDYFYKAQDGTYRLPESDEEEQLKAEGRAKGLGRRIKRYLSYLQQGVAVPEKERPNGATLAEWIRHCRRSGLFEQGRLLFEKGGAALEGLTDEAQVEVEEDYEVCVRGLTRAPAVAAKPKRGRPQQATLEL